MQSPPKDGVCEVPVPFSNRLLGVRGAIPLGWVLKTSILLALSNELAHRQIAVIGPRIDSGGVAGGQRPAEWIFQRPMLIDAWNEDGEGGYLTPTAKDSTNYLRAIQRAIAGEQ